MLLLYSKIKSNTNIFNLCIYSSFLFSKCSYKTTIISFSG
nr:MAG TPA: hypothetical protein [Caudoviricetes sp.]